MKRELRYIILSRATNNPSKSRMWLASRRLATPDMDEKKQREKNAQNTLELNVINPY